MRRGFLTLLMLAALLLTTAGAASADDAALGRRGETVYPLSHQSIRMAAEEVRLKISVQRTAVDLTFTFVNEGPAQSVLMGFPVGRLHPDEERGDPELHDFAAWIDGQPVAVKREQGATGPVETTDGMGWKISYPEWISWTVDFAAGQSRTIRNTYWGSNYHNSIGEVSTGYILRTGATWQGPIGQAVIVAEFDGVLPGQITEASPASYRWEGDRLLWRMENFEPERDIAIWFMTRPEGEIPPGELMGPIMQAEWDGGPEGLRALRAARLGQLNPGPAADSLDLALAKFEYLYGDREAARQIARLVLESGSSHATAVYIAQREGWRRPSELLALPDLTPGIVRYLRDAGGFEGSPPDMPRIEVRPWGVELLPYLLVSDPDNDLDRWGVKIWATPYETAEPLFEARGSLNRYQGNQVELLPRDWTDGEAVWYRAWAVDARGHRVESPLTKLVLREPPTPPPAPAQEYSQPVTATAEVTEPQSPRATWLLLIALAALALLTATAMLGRRRT